MTGAFIDRTCASCGEPSPLTDEQWDEFDRKASALKRGEGLVAYTCKCGFAERLVVMSFFPKAAA